MPQTSETTIRVLIVAAYASVRAGLHSLLTEASGCTVLGEIGGSAELEPLLPQLRPDVIVFDDNEADAPRLVELLDGSATGLVLLGEDRQTLGLLAHATLAGWAYLRKEADGAEIAGAIHAVAAGLVALDRSVSPQFPGLHSEGTPAPLDPPTETLTAREYEVLQLMARGLPNKNIAARLAISQHTVKFHVASILAKLGASSRTEAVTIGARRGHITL